MVEAAAANSEGMLHLSTWFLFMASGLLPPQLDVLTVRVQKTMVTPHAFAASATPFSEALPSDSEMLSSKKAQMGHHFLFGVENLPPGVEVVPEISPWPMLVLLLPAPGFFPEAPA